MNTHEPVGIIGTGNLGTAIARGLMRAGHSVVFGSRSPNGDKTQAVLRALGERARAAELSDVARLCPLLILTTPWVGVRETLNQLGDLRGRILVDATNAVGPGFTQLTFPAGSSSAQVAQWAPAARVVKAFNTTGWENVLDPIYDGAATVMPICGDDADAKENVAALAQAIGFDVVDAGGMSAAPYLEGMAMLWIRLAVQQKQGRGVAFRLVRR